MTRVVGKSYFYFFLQQFSFHSLELFTGIRWNSLACEYEVCSTSHLTQEEQTYIGLCCFIQVLCSWYLLKVFAFECKSAFTKKKKFIKHFERGAAACSKHRWSTVLWGS